MKQKPETAKDAKEYQYRKEGLGELGGKEFANPSPDP